MTALLDELRSLVGPTHVVTEVNDLAPVLTDWRGRYAGQALALVKPASTAEVAAVVRACAAAGVAVTPQGGNTGLCGGATPIAARPQIVLRLDRMNRIRAIGRLGDWIAVDAGCVLADVQQAAADRGRLFPLSLGAEGSCQIGGNLSTNAGGVAALRYGVARDLVLGLEVVLPDGSIYDAMSRLRKDATGYDLKQLFIGAEGTLGIITGATLKLFARPTRRATAMARVSTFADALALLTAARDRLGDRLAAFEVMSRTQLDIIARHAPQVAMPLAIEAGWFVLIEIADVVADFDAAAALEAMLAAAMESGLVADAVLATSEAQAEALWRIRHAAPEVGRKEGFVVSHDSSVPVDSLAEFVARLERRVPEVAPDAALAILGHAGDGNLHVLVILPHDSVRDAAAREARVAAINAVVDAETAALGGAISAEHGVGCANLARFAAAVDPVEMALMRAVKATLDPAGLMNPGKLLPPASA
ncbi:MAG: FAD-binding oxidoreductase [Methylobacteriaceae bacterium]|nr:FAD-binding oxidoreductase [Methylobacteriaceae bacterium]